MDRVKISVYPTRGLAVVMLGWLPDVLIASYGVSYEVPLGEEKGRKSSAALEKWLVPRDASR